MNYTFCVPCLLGVEGLVADELRYQHFEGVRTENGRVYFEGPMAECARANLRLRCGERVLLRLASFPAYTFEDLFQGVKSIPWADYLQNDSIFPVVGYCVGSQLHSVPDCQRIIKKAVVECLKERCNLSWFPETGVKYQIRFALLEDQAEIYLDTTGAPLYKRGYRLATQQAPLRETLAASLVKITRYRGREELIDPFCGSGTLAIEAAMVCLPREHAGALKGKTGSLRITLAGRKSVSGPWGKKCGRNCPSPPAIFRGKRWNWPGRMPDGPEWKI